MGGALRGNLDSHGITADLSAVSHCASVTAGSESDREQEQDSRGSLHYYR
jgi:hypothetical protein